MSLSRRHSSASAGSRGCTTVSSSHRSLVVAPSPPKDPEDIQKRASATIRCQSASTQRANRRKQYAYDRILDDSIPRRPTSASTVGGLSRIASASRQGTGAVEGLGSRQNTFKTQTHHVEPTPQQREATLIPTPPAPNGKTVGPPSPGTDPQLEASTASSGQKRKDKKGDDGLDPILSLHLQIAHLQGKRTHPLVEELAGSNSVSKGQFGSGANFTPPSTDDDEETVATDDDIMHGATAGGPATIFVSRRMIQERIERRVKLYRDDPAQRRLLNERVRRFKAVRGGAMDHFDEFGLPAVHEEQVAEEKRERQRHIREHGVTILEEFYKGREAKYDSLKISPRDGSTWVNKNKDRSLHHRATANRVWREELAHKKSVMGRHNEIVADADEVRRQEAESLVACEWANVISVANRGKLFLKILMLHHFMQRLQHAYYVRKEYWATWLIPVRKAMYLKRRDYLQKRLRFAIIAARIWATISLRRQGCQMLKKFVKHLVMAGRFHIALQHYRKKVLKCQQYIRNHLRYRTVRLNLLMMMWDRKEEWLRFRLAENHRQDAIKRRLIQQRSAGMSSAGAGAASLRPKSVQQQAAGSNPNSPVQNGMSRQPSGGGTRKRMGTNVAKSGVVGRDLEVVQDAKIADIVRNDPFRYDMAIPFSSKLKALTEDWVSRRIAFVKKDLRVSYYSDKLDYERRLATWEKKFAAGASKSLPPKPQPPKLREFPLFMPSERFDNLVEKTMDRFQEDVRDIRQQAACEVVRAHRPESEYVPTRDQLMHERFQYDVLEKRKFFSRMQKAVFAAPSIKGGLNKGRAERKPRMSVFVPR